MPLEINATAPTTARMYDFWLGGHDNFAVNRAAAPAVSEAVPEIGLMALENREFLRRAIRYLAGGAGIAQFPDIGTGLPTHRNVHHVVEQVNPDARVVYVDNDAKSGFSVLSGASPLGPARDRRHGRRTSARGRPGVSDDDAGRDPSA